MQDVPVPEDSGSSGTQQAGTHKSAPELVSSPIEGLPITSAIQGIVASGPRSFGSEVSTKLLAASFAQLSQDLAIARNTTERTQDALSKSQEQLTEYKVRAARLEEQVCSSRNSRNLSNLIITAGITLIAIGIEFYRTGFDKISYLLFAVGAELILAGWFPRMGT